MQNLITETATQHNFAIWQKGTAQCALLTFFTEGCTITAATVQ
jgi:hypothetical protein